jgi:hypothetical protein
LGICSHSWAFARLLKGVPKGGKGRMDAWGVSVGWKGKIGGGTGFSSVDKVGVIVGTGTSLDARMDGSVVVTPGVSTGWRVGSASDMGTVIWGGWSRIGRGRIRYCSALKIGSDRVAVEGGLILEERIMDGASVVMVVGWMGRVMTLLDFR